jgi:hypothetical protein
MGTGNYLSLSKKKEDWSLLLFLIITLLLTIVVCTLPSYLYFFFFFGFFFSRFSFSCPAGGSMSGRSFFLLDSFPNDSACLLWCFR